MPLIQTQDTNRADCCQTLLVAYKCSHLLHFGANKHTHTHTTCCIAPQTRPYYAKYLTISLAQIVWEWVGLLWCGGESQALVMVLLTELHPATIQFIIPPTPSYCPNAASAIKNLPYHVQFPRHNLNIYKRWASCMPTCDTIFYQLIYFIGYIMRLSCSLLSAQRSANVVHLKTSVKFIVQYVRLTVRSLQPYTDTFNIYRNNS